MIPDSCRDMLAAVQAFHEKHRLRETAGEELNYRIALMVEELGAISASVMKGKSKDSLSEEIADLLILLMGTGIAQEIDLNQAFWRKIEQLDKRGSRMIGGDTRVSEFHGVND